MYYVNNSNNNTSSNNDPISAQRKHSNVFYLLLETICAHAAAVASSSSSVLFPVIVDVSDITTNFFVTLVKGNKNINNYSSSYLLFPLCVGTDVACFPGGWSSEVCQLLLWGRDSRSSATATTTATAVVGATNAHENASDSIVQQIQQQHPLQTLHHLLQQHQQQRQHQHVQLAKLGENIAQLIQVLNSIAPAIADSRFFEKKELQPIFHDFPSRESLEVYIELRKQLAATTSAEERSNRSSSNRNNYTNDGPSHQLIFDIMTKLEETKEENEEERPLLLPSNPLTAVPPLLQEDDVSTRIHSACSY